MSSHKMFSFNNSSSWFSESEFVKLDFGLTHTPKGSSKGVGFLRVHPSN